MNLLTAWKEGLQRFAQSLLIVGLAGLLIFYHIIMLTDFARGQSLSDDTGYNIVQALLRIGIVVSLSLVVLGKRKAIWTMWLCIGGLIATHYWAHLGMVEADFTNGRHALSYLKGFIIPTIITAAFFYRPRRVRAAAG